MCRNPYCRFLRYQPSEPVPARFDNDKSVSEFCFGIRVQHFLKLAMACVHGCGQNTQINDTLPGVFNKDECTKISIPCDKEAFLVLRHTQEHRICCLGTPNLCCRDYVVL